jgi:hypothetical protein
MLLMYEQVVNVRPYILFEYSVSCTVAITGTVYPIPLLFKVLHLHPSSFLWLCYEEESSKQQINKQMQNTH